MIKQFLRSEQDTGAVRRRVRRLPRSQSTESSGRGEGSNSGLQRCGCSRRDVDMVWGLGGNATGRSACSVHDARGRAEQDDGRGQLRGGENLPPDTL